MYYADNHNQQPYGNENEIHQNHYNPDDPNQQNQNQEDPNHHSLTDQTDLAHEQQANNNNQYDDYDNLSSANY